jgi:muramoyltetrapeptide carboxypeptidase LdcA involved in peptidoglycan recycling
MTFERPPALDEGGTVAFLAPSAPVPSERVERAAARLSETVGVETVTYPTAERTPADGAAPPAERAEELMAAFSDPGIDAVIAVTGGDDQLRVLSHLDPERLRRNPTRFFGYSDNDNLRLYLWTLGQISWGITAHPDLTVDQELHPYVERYLSRALFDDNLGSVEPATEWTDEWFDFETEEPRSWRTAPGWTWRDRGAVAGPVWGGSLAIVAWHLQTERYLPDPEQLDGAVLALETSETLPRAREVGYLLRSLGERGWLSRFAGVVVGRPRAHNPTLAREPDFDEYRTAIRREVETQLDRYAPETTAVFDVDFGHTSPIFPLPLGATAELNPESGTISFE